MADLPQSFDGAVELGRDVFDSILKICDERGVPHFIGLIVADLIALLPLYGALIFATVLALIKDIIVPTSVTMLQVLSQLRQDAAPELAEVAGAVMGEFLGFEVTPDKFSAEQGIEGNIQRANVLGSALHDLLTHEFTKGEQVTPESGAAAARTFSGYNINFAAQNAIMALFFDMASIHQAEEIRELGVEVAQNLGLGRLHRSAMKPLIDNLIVHPYTKFMNAKYQQQSLSVQQLCQGYLAGDIDRPYLTQQLLYAGYPEPLHSTLIGFYTPQLTVQEVWAIVKTGEVTADEGINMLRRNGWSDTFARNKMAAFVAEIQLRQETKVLSTLEGLVRDRFMDTDTFLLELRKLHLYDDDIELIRRDVGYTLEYRHKHLTLAEVLYLVDRNLITENDVDEWMAEIGFNDKDRLTMSLYFASKELDYEAQVQAKKDAAAKKKAAATPKPPTKKPIEPEEQV